MGVPGASTTPPSGPKKRAYAALERRFGSNLQVSAPQESKIQKSKLSRSRVRKRDVTRDAGRDPPDRPDANPTPVEVHHGDAPHLAYLGFSQTIHEDITGSNQEAKKLKPRKNRDGNRDVARDAGEEGPLDLMDIDSSRSRDKIPANAPFCKKTQGVRGCLDDNSGKARHPAYAGLSKTPDENLIKISDKDASNGVGYAVKFMHDLLLNGDCSEKYMKGTQKMKFDDWFLLDNLVPDMSSTNERTKSLQSHSRRSMKHMSMKQHRKCGSFDFPQEFHMFDLFKPMHEMWKGYIAKLLKETGRNQMSSRLLTADLHGAMLLVAECASTSFTGIKGIMVRETTKTFGIVTENNRFRVVPKRGSIFIFQAGSWKITLVGDKLSSRIIGT